MRTNDDRTTSSRFELSALILITVVVGAAWGAVEIADLPREGASRSLDEVMLSVFRSSSDRTNPVGSRGIEDISRNISSMGSNAVLVFVSIIVVSYLLAQGRKKASWLVVASIVGSLGISFVLKLLFDRPRPDLSVESVHVTTSSFPSGHAMVSMAVYTLFAALLARLDSRRWVKIFFLASAVLINLVIGITRLHLGTHWPTDLLAGWTIGAAWTTLCWLTAYARSHEPARMESTAV